MLRYIKRSVGFPAGVIGVREVSERGDVDSIINGDVTAVRGGPIIGEDVLEAGRGTVHLGPDRTAEHPV